MLHNKLVLAKACETTAISHVQFAAGILASA
jgi:hypothetical protein